MDTIFQKIPFLRIVLAFALGIISGNYLNIPLLPCLLCVIVVLLILRFLQQNYTYQKDSVFGILVLVLFVLLGQFFFADYNKTPQFVRNGIYQATILERPQEKSRSYKSVINTFAVKKGDSIFRVNEKIIVYFSKNERVKLLQPGSVILFETSPQFVKNYGNPYEFDYKNYLQKKRIYRQVYLANNQWQPTGSKKYSLHIYSELFREKLLKSYRQQNLGANETEILSALTLGYKRNLEPDTKRVFSSAGVIHVLAVSGLHVGILYMVFAFFFGFLRKQNAGKYIFIVASVLLLWTYAFITGLSPSVMRAATMFSIVIIGSNINRRASIYNSLAASALFLLLINPNNLFEVGFQLSYLAVFGIVFLQPKLGKIWQPKVKIVKFFWLLLTVSFAAQLATFPVTIYYFSLFPTYFWVSNLIVIPAVTILIPLGILLLLVSTIPYVSFGLAFVIKWLIKAIYSALQFIEHFPFSTLEASLSPFELTCLLLCLIFVLVFIERPKVFYLKFAFSWLSILFLALLISGIKQYYTREIIVYNNNSNSTIHFIAGRTNYVVSAAKIHKNDFLFRQIQDVKRKKRLAAPIFLLQNELFKDRFLLQYNGICFFEGKSVFYGAKPDNLPAELDSLFLIYQRNVNYPEHLLNNTTHIISSQQIRLKNFKHPIFSLQKSGSFNAKW